MDSEKRRERKAESKTVVKSTHKWGSEIEVNGGMALPKGNHLSQSHSRREKARKRRGGGNWKKKCSHPDKGR